MLPKLPYKGRRIEREIVDFRGLDRTEGAPEGALADATNLSTEEYPTLTQRAPRTQVTGYTAPTDIFGWDGHLVVVDGGQLKLDGTAIGEINPGKKQFAVVNTKLCVWPDKVYVDLTNNTMQHMDAALSTGTQAGTVTVTDDSFSATVTQAVKSNEQLIYAWSGAQMHIVEGYAAYSYGVDRAAVEACFDLTDGWDTQALGDLPGAKYAGTVSAGGQTSGQIVPGDIIIPKVTEISANPPYLRYSIVVGLKSGTVLPDTVQYNQDGYYIVIKSGPTLYDEEGYYLFVCDVFRCGTGNALFSAVFKAGDAVNITGTRYGISDVKHAVITAIDDDTNTLTFPEGTLRAPAYYHVTAADLPADIAVKISFPDSAVRTFTPGALIPAGRVLYTGTYGVGDSLYVWNTAAKTVEATYTLASDAGPGLLSMSAYDPIDGASIGVAKDVPDFDFICAKDNRLWGVSNAQTNEVWNAQTQRFDSYTARVIFASALGDPTNWYAFQGVDTDSWQVAVATEGDFTALCAFGGSVCAWKENRLHRVFGSNPSEYYMSEAIFDGVAAGCARSVTVVNEVMYYVGRNNVYAYAGGKVPQAVGTPLGRPYADAQAVAGSNGRRLYLGWKTGASASELLTFDLARGLWMREDDKTAAAFADVGGALYLLCSDGALWRLEHGDETISWSATFRPFDETKITYKHYIRVCLRLDMAEGSAVTVKVKFDNGTEQTLLSADATRTMTKEIMLPPNRADRFTVTVSGTGNVKLRHLSREYYPGSERV